MGEGNSDKSDRISSWMKQIAEKVPEITKLESKLGILKGLDPVLQSVLNDLNKATDNDCKGSNIKKVLICKEMDAQKKDESFSD